MAGGVGVVGYGSGVTVVVVAVVTPVVVAASAAVPFVAVFKEYMVFYSYIF